MELAFLVGLVLLAVHAWRRFGAPYGGYVLVAVALPLRRRVGRSLDHALRPGRLPGLCSRSRTSGRRRWVHVAAAAVGVTWLATSVVKWSLWNWVA